MKNMDLPLQQIGRKLGLTKKKTCKLARRLKVNFTVMPKTAVKKSKIWQKHIQFMEKWLDSEKNVGKSFKFAFAALKQAFPEEDLEISSHGAYKSFKK